MEKREGEEVEEGIKVKGREDELRIEEEIRMGKGEVKKSDHERGRKGGM